MCTRRGRCFEALLCHGSVDTSVDDTLLGRRGRGGKQLVRGGGEGGREADE